MSTPLPDWLVKWRATVAEGICPACRKPLPPRKVGRPAYIHAARENPDCRAAYQRQRYDAMAGKSSLREIVSVTFPKDKPGRAVVTLSCKCILDLQGHAARRATKRMRCPNHP